MAPIDDATTHLSGSTEGEAEQAKLVTYLCAPAKVVSASCSLLNSSVDTLSGGVGACCANFW